MSNEENPQGGRQARPHPQAGPAAHGGWQPTPHGDYDYEATAFVHLPPEDVPGAPLEAPGHGYVPPMILPLTPAADPQVPQVWQTPQPPGAGPAGAEQHWPEPADHHSAVPRTDELPQTGAYGSEHLPQEHPQAAVHEPQTATHDPRRTGHAGHGSAHDPHATGQWSFAEAGQPVPVPAADVTGQWTIPVARGDLPEETGEYTASMLQAQWNAAPATLPGGATAPWATEPSATPPSSPAEPSATLPGDAPAPWAGEQAPESDGSAPAAAPTAEAPVPAPAAAVEAPAAPAAEAPAEALAVETPVSEGAVPAAPAPADAVHPPAVDAASAEAPAPVAEAPAAPVQPAQPVQSAPAPAQMQAQAPEHAHAAEPAPAPAGQPEHPESAPAAEPQGPEPAEVAVGAEPSPHGETPAGHPPVLDAEAPAQPANETAEAAEEAEEAEPLEAAAAPEPDTARAPETAGTPEPVPGTPEPDPPVLAPVTEEHPPTSYVLRVNGVDRPVADAWIGESLLYVLRERLGLAGAKDGCSQGECGACNVQVDGRLVASCLVPAATAAGSEVRTVEGLASDGEPSDVQRALAACGAVQCGFCIPGMAMTVHDLLEGNHSPTELETRQALCGNLCRCSGYRGVLDAVREVVASRGAGAATPSPSDITAAAATTGTTATPEAAAMTDVRIPHQAPPGAGSVQAHPHDGGMA